MAKNNKKDSSDFTYDIKKEYGYLNEKKNKLVAKVSWNDKDPKIDIRSCYEKDGEIKLGKGISLSYDELGVLKDILDNISESDEDDDQEDNPTDSSPPKRQAVNFDEIFGQATGIVEKREAGYTTKDGFIVLKKRPGTKI